MKPKTLYTMASMPGVRLITVIKLLLCCCLHSLYCQSGASLKSGRAVRAAPLYFTQNSFDVVKGMYIINKLTLMLVAN